MYISTPQHFVRDTFSITATGPMFPYSNSGPLTSGSIQINSE